MASYHLSVKSVSRSSGRSAVAAAAYRAAEKLTDERQAKEHDYRRKSGVAHTEMVVPDDAPEWTQNRNLLWNAAEAAENRKNSVVAREWELALPSELDDVGRRGLALGFAKTLVVRYGVVADVCIHAPHREGDQRNHHAHVLTTTREVGADGFGAKTRILDVKQTSSIEVAAMREVWAEHQNAALERVGDVERVDHRTLEAQRMDAEAERDRLAQEMEAQRAHTSMAVRRKVPDNPIALKIERALSREGIDPAASLEAVSDKDWTALENDLARKTLEAAALDREPELKLGPAANAMERKAVRDAKSEGRAYAPVTEVGAKVQAVREHRSLFDAAIERLGEVRGRVGGALRDVASWLRDGLWPRDKAEVREGQGERFGRFADPGGSLKQAAQRQGAPEEDTVRRSALEPPVEAVGRGQGETAQPMVSPSEKVVPDVAKATESMILQSEEIVHLVDDPEKRVRLSAQLGQEKIRLAALAGRPDWAEGAGPAHRPVAEARAALAKTATGGDRERILTETDRNALSAFEDAGIEPQAALHRIRYEGPVDRARAALWHSEEVAESARSRGAGEGDATWAVEHAHVTAYRAYDQAAKRFRESARQSQKAEAARAEQRDAEEKSRKRSRGRKL